MAQNIIEITISKYFRYSNVQIYNKTRIVNYTPGGGVNYIRMITIMIRLHNDYVR